MYVITASRKLRVACRELQEINLLVPLFFFLKHPNIAIDDFNSFAFVFDIVRLLFRKKKRIRSKGTHFTFLNFFGLEKAFCELKWSPFEFLALTDFF